MLTRKQRAAIDDIPAFIRRLDKGMVSLEMANQFVEFASLMLSASIAIRHAYPVKNLQFDEAVEKFQWNWNDPLEKLDEI